MTEEVTNNEPGFVSEVIDGAAGMCFLKDDIALDSFGKRVGASLPGIALGAFAHGRLMVKRGLRVLPESQRKAVIAATPLGSLTIGK